MNDQQGVIRHIAWRDLFPWLILLRTFRIAISPALLAVATLAVIIAPLGWGLAELVFQPPRSSGRAPLPAIRDDLPDAPPSPASESPRRDWRSNIPRAENSYLARRIPPAVRPYLPVAETALLEVYLDLAEPLARFFQLQMTVRETAYYAFGTLWTLAIWAFVGGVVTRRAIVQLAADTPLDIRQTTTYACRRYLWYFLTPLYPLLGVLLLTVPIALVGLPIRLFLGLGSVIAGLLWILVAIAGLGALWLLGGLILGWPLMWPTISAERDGDPFEAFSRSFSYVYGKPLHYFFYVVVAAAFGALCWGLVWAAATLTQEFGFWALAWGGGGQNVEAIRDAAMRFAEGLPALPGQSTAVAVGTTLIGLVVGLIRSAAAAFQYTYFFCAASAIYLLLRRDVDEKEMDEVFVEDRTTAAQPAASAAAPPPAPAQPAAAQQPAATDSGDAP